MIKTFKSPPYPAINLERAVVRAKELREVAKAGHSVPLGSAARAWGFSEKSSSITSVVGALNQFGLIEDEGSGASRRIRLSRLADAIILDPRPDSAERRRALQTSALSPKVFKEIWDAYSTADVDDHTLIYDLTLGRKNSGKAPFSESAALDVANLYRDSLHYAGLVQGDAVASKAGVAMQSEEPLERQRRGDPFDAVDRLDHPLQPEIFEEKKALDEGEAILRWPRDLSPESVDDVEYWLNGVIRQMKRRSGSVPPRE